MKRTLVTISALQHRCQTHEAAPFAGLWLQHEPACRIIVACTRDGVETINRARLSPPHLLDSLTLAQLQSANMRLRS